MILPFIHQLTAFFSMGIISVFSIAENRASPPVSYDEGPSMSLPWSPKKLPTIAIVQPSYEFRLVRGPRQKRRRNTGEVRPAWGMLYIITIAVLYVDSFNWVEKIIAPINS